MSQGEAYELRTCEACGCPLIGKARTARFCGGTCQNWAWRNRNRKRPASRACPTCGVVFSWNGRQRFCSKLCSEIFCGRRKIGPRGGVIVCLVCEKRKAVYNPTKDKVCGPCRPEWENQRNAQWRAANPERVRASEHRRATTPERRTYHRELSRRLHGSKPRPPRPQRFLVRSDVAWSRARVSIAARPATRTFVCVICSECGKHFIRGPRHSGMCCSEACQKHRSRRLHRRKHGLTKRERQIVFMRDKFICQLCGWDLDMDAEPGTPLSATIDHTVAKVRGGVDVIPLVQAAHQLCNSRRGAMSMEEWEALHQLTS